MSKLIKLSTNNLHALAGQSECGVGDPFVMGDWVIQCPGCKTYYHVDCWSEYGNKCPRNSYSCWDEKVLVLDLRGAWGGIRKGLFVGGGIGCLLGLLVGTVGIAVRAEHPWSVAGFVAGGIYSLLVVAILGQINKITFSSGLFIFIVGTLAIVVYPKIGLAVGTLFNMLCFVLIGLFFIRARKAVVLRGLFVMMNLLLLIFGTWLTLLIGSGGNLATGGLYFGVIGIIVGTAVGIETMAA